MKALLLILLLMNSLSVFAEGENSSLLDGTCEEYEAIDTASGGKGDTSGDSDSSKEKQKSK